MKEQLKELISKAQNGQCAISGTELPENKSLYDTDRKQPKAEGGIYTVKNTRLLNPIVHMIRHENYKKRDEKMEALKNIVDAKEQLIKLRNKINNQFLAYERNTDQMDNNIIDLLEKQEKETTSQVGKQERKIAKLIKEIAEIDPLTKAMINLRSVGENTAAYMLVYIDIEKARHPSSLWKYAGLHASSSQRYQKGVAGGGNKRLRSALWNMANSQMKQQGVYREVYDNVKNRLSVSEKETKTRNTQGKEVVCKWKDTKPGHRHGAAIRAIMKHFLADYWYVARTLKGLETNPTYAEAQLGMSHKTIKPEERGWVY